MKIVNERAPSVTVSEIPAGQCFIYTTQVYMKLKNTDTDYNCVHLVSGELYGLFPGTIVTPVSSVVTIQ